MARARAADKGNSMWVALAHPIFNDVSYYRWIANYMHKLTVGHWIRAELRVARKLTAPHPSASWPHFLLCLNMSRVILWSKSWLHVKCYIIASCINIWMLAVCSCFYPPLTVVMVAEWLSLTLGEFDNIEYSGVVCSALFMERKTVS